MSGTKAGGLKAAATNKLLHGDNFYAEIGAIGGKKGTTGGFASDVTCNCELYPEEHKYAYCAGKKGGTISKRSKASYTKEQEAYKKAYIDGGIAALTGKR